MTRAYVGLGSNVDPERNVRAAVRLLADRARVCAVSTFYRTESVPPGARAFVNGVVALETSETPWGLKELLRETETCIGRVRTADKNGPRTIDCDLLVYDGEAFRDGDLVLPAPDIADRAFIAIPLFELAPELILPGSGKKLADVVAAVPRHPMSPLADLTDNIRTDLKEKSDGPGTRRGARPRASR